MATYYVDPALGSGNDDGTDWANAWSTLQRAIDGTNGTQPVAGDTVLLKSGGGTDESLAVAVDMDGNSGTNAGGYIRYIGVNSSGTNDGTRYTIDMQANNADGIAIAADMIWYENIKVMNTGTEDGFKRISSGSGSMFLNCCATGCDYGFNMSAQASLLCKCVSYANNYGFYCAAANFLFCNAHDNTYTGYVFSPIMYGCLSYDNGDDGYNNISPNGSLIINCIAEGNTNQGIESGTTTSTSVRNAYIGCRITNNGGAGDFGLNCSGENIFTIGCYFEDNNTNLGNDSLHNNIVLANDQDQADTNEGYTDLTDGAEDFNLRSDASLRRNAITIPLV